MVEDGKCLTYSHRLLLAGVLLVAAVALVGALFNGRVQAQTAGPGPEVQVEETLETVVTRVVREQWRESPDGQRQRSQELELAVTKGSLAGQTITVESGNLSLANLPRYKVGDELLVLRRQAPRGDEVYFISDYIRRTPLLYLFAAFVIIAVAVGRWWGVTSIIGMGFSFLVIFVFILPRILAGGDPVITTVVGSLFIIPVTFYLSHGVNRKTSIAVVGTVIALVITGTLAVYFVDFAKLSGYASEEAAFLRSAQFGGAVDVRGLLLAGIIIGTLGVLDDVTVSQASIVRQLRRTDVGLPALEIYRRAMAVGQDHISSMVNTLVLVYTGASLPLLLLFLDARTSFWEVVNYEVVADEIVRTLVGSIGLMLAVPITTFLSCYYGEGRVADQGSEGTDPAESVDA